MYYIKDGKIKELRHISVVVDGERYFNAPESMVLADGWKPYIPEAPAITQEEQYKQRIVELVRERYSVDDEIAILRQRDSKIEEFNEYNAYVERCKEIAHNEVYGGMV